MCGSSKSEVYDYCKTLINAKFYGETNSREQNKVCCVYPYFDLWEEGRMCLPLFTAYPRVKSLSVSAMQDGSEYQFLVWPVRNSNPQPRTEGDHLTIVIVSLPLLNVSGWKKPEYFNLLSRNYQKNSITQTGFIRDILSKSDLHTYRTTYFRKTFFLENKICFILWITK